MDLEETFDENAVGAMDSTNPDLGIDLRNFDSQIFPLSRRWLSAQWKNASIILEAYEDILNPIVQQYIKKASKVFVKVGQMQDYSKMCRIIFRFVSESDAEHATKVFRNLQINGKHIEVFRMEPDQEQLENLPNDDAPALIMTNIGKDLASEDVEQLFPTARIVTMIKDKDGNPIGAARIEYKTMALARAVYKENKDMKIDDKAVTLHLYRKLIPAASLKIAPKRKTDTTPAKGGSGAKKRQVDASTGGRGKGTTSLMGGRGKGTPTSMGGRGIGKPGSMRTNTYSAGANREENYERWLLGTHARDMDRPPSLMDNETLPVDRYHNYDEGFERYERRQDFGDERMGRRMAGDFDGMGGNYDRMGVRGAENELAKLAMNRENVRGLDVNAAAPLILGLATQLAEKMTAGQGAHNDRSGMASGQSGGGMYGHEGQSSMRGRSRLSNAEAKYTGGYTHQGLERNGADDGFGGRAGLGQANNFDRERSRFGAEGRGFDSNGFGGFDRKAAGRVSETGFGFGGGSGFETSGSRLGGFGGGGGGSGGRFGGGESRLGGRESGFGDASGFGGSRYDRGDTAESRYALGDRGYNRASSYDMDAVGFGRSAGGGWGMGRGLGRY